MAHLRYLKVVQVELGPKRRQKLLVSPLEADKVLNCPKFALQPRVVCLHHIHLAKQDKTH